MRITPFLPVLFCVSIISRQDLQAAFEFKGHGSNYMAGGCGGIAAADVIGKILEMKMMRMEELFFVQVVKMSNIYKDVK